MNRDVIVGHIGEALSDVSPGLTSTSASARTKVYVVEALRGFAALAVAWFHLTNTYEWDLVRLFGTYGWIELCSRLGDEVDQAA